MTRVHLYLIRHGESVYNKENKFCGWYNADLTDQGKNEAASGANTIKKAIADNGKVTRLFTSYLQRAQKTLDIIVENISELKEIPIVKSWRLNERHYGGLQGLNKAETAKKYGEDQVQIWRRSFDIPPPQLKDGEVGDPKIDALYADVPKEELPLCESLKDTIQRVKPFYESSIVPELLGGQNVLVAAHGNTTRSILKMIANIGDQEIVKLEIPTGIPVHVTFDIADGKLVYNEWNFISDDPEALKAAQEKVRAQGKAK